LEIRARISESPSAERRRGARQKHKRDEQSQAGRKESDGVPTNQPSLSNPAMKNEAKALYWQFPTTSLLLRNLQHHQPPPIHHPSQKQAACANNHSNQRPHRILISGQESFL
jgi:hypothetical protein